MNKKRIPIIEAKNIAKKYGQALGTKKTAEPML